MEPESIRDVTANELSKFAGELRSRGKSDSVIARSLGELRRALEWAANLRLIDRAPFVPAPQVRRGNSMLGRPITTEEFERMLAKTREVVGPVNEASMRDTLMKYWLSGFRRTEALDIWWD